jgi:hypothetical protein
MARRIAPIFEAVLADPRIQGRERDFVNSLYDYYKSRKSLTAGRRRCLLQIEERLKAAPAEIDESVDSELSDLLTRAEAAKDVWAVDFTKSLRGQLLAGRELSPAQKSTLDKIKARHSDEAQAERDSWASNFTSEMRQKLVIAAHYYTANPPYFGDLARKVLADDSFVPSKRSYEKMVENKYAAKVIVSTTSKPKYNPGSHVMLGASAPWQIRRTTDGKNRTSSMAIVLKAGAKPVTSAARGTKVYSILFFGEAQPVFAEERWLKKGKR